MGSSRLNPCMRDFDDFIKESELVDPPLRNVLFTWFNYKNPLFARG